MKTVEITLYAIFIGFMVLAIYKIYNMPEKLRESFGNPTVEDEQMPTPKEFRENTQCIVKLKTQSPLQSCGKIGAGISPKIEKYNIMVDSLQNVLSGITEDISNSRKNYSSQIDQLIAAYKTSEDMVRQQNYFKGQNTSVLALNTKYKTDLTKTVDMSKETYYIESDLFKTARDADAVLIGKIAKMQYYTKWLLMILIVGIFLYLAQMEFGAQSSS
jgi:hypothetical protein